VRQVGVPQGTPTAETGTNGQALPQAAPVHQ
jgi:hypothetical protein